MSEDRAKHVVKDLILASFIWGFGYCTVSDPSHRDMWEAHVRELLKDQHEISLFRMFGEDNEYSLFDISFNHQTLLWELLPRQYGDPYAELQYIHQVADIVVLVSPTHYRF